MFLRLWLSILFFVSIGCCGDSHDYCYDIICGVEYPDGWDGSTTVVDIYL